MKNTFKLWTLLLVLVMFSTPTWGRELTVGGSLNLEYQVLTESTPYQGQWASGLRLDVSSFGGNTNLVASLEIDDIHESILLREAYGELYTGSTDWTMGIQFIPWGVMDGSSPTDVINPLNYAKPLAGDNRLAVAALRARHYVGDWELDGVWLPRFEPHLLPEDLPNHQQPDLRLANGEVGVRISRWLPGMDAAVSYYYGWDRNALPQMDPASNQSILVHQRYHMFGASAAKDFGAAVGRGELACFLPEKTDPYLHYAFSGDRHLTNDLLLMAQLNGVLGDERTQTAVSMSLQYEVAPHVQASLRGIYSFTDQDILVNPTVAWDAADGVELTAGMYFIHGDGALGNLRPKQNIYVRASYAF